MNVPDELMREISAYLWDHVTPEGHQLWHKIKALAAAPTPPVQEMGDAERLRCGVSRQEWHDKAWALHNAKTFDDTQLQKVNIHTIRSVFNATYDSIITDRVAPEVEPVAWMIDYMMEGAKRRAICGHNAIADYRDIDPDATATPLYTRANDGLRRRADILCGYIENGSIQKETLAELGRKLGAELDKKL